jgi:hypothetical protein
MIERRRKPGNHLAGGSLFDHGLNASGCSPARKIAAPAATAVMSPVPGMTARWKKWSAGPDTSG